MTLLQRDRENLELGHEEGLIEGRKEGSRHAIKIIKLHSQGMDDKSIASSLQLDLEYVHSVISEYEND